MRRLTRKGSLDQKVRWLAGRIVGDCPARDFECYAGALRAWLGNHVLHLPDPSTAEMLHAAPYMIDVVYRDGYFYGDCDDLSILAGALASAMGLPVRLVVLGFPPFGVWAHVWAEVQVGAEWVNMDVTRGIPTIDPSRRKVVYI